MWVQDNPSGALAGALPDGYHSGTVVDLSAAGAKVVQVKKHILKHLRTTLRNEVSPFHYRYTMVKPNI